MKLKINYDLLEENTDMPVSFYDTMVEEFSEKIKTTWTWAKSGIYGLIWPYGTGKSTMLEELSKKIKKENKYYRVNFDAWKYPDRKNLLDELVLEIIKQTWWTKEDERKYLCKVEWKVYIWDTRNIWLVVLFGFFMYLSLRFWWLDDNIVSILADVFTIIGFWSIVFTILKERINNISRIGQFADVFKEKIGNLNKDIIIVLEDIDRSWQEGKYFLETLSALLRTHNGHHRIICIAPVDTNNFVSDYDHYMKCFRLYSDFDLKKTFTELLSAAIEVSENDALRWLNSFSLFLTELVNNTASFSIREIKSLLRKCLPILVQLNNHKKYKNDEELFFVLILLFSKFIKREQNPNWPWEAIQSDIKRYRITTNSIWDTKRVDQNSNLIFFSQVFIDAIRPYLSICSTISINWQEYRGISVEEQEQYKWIRLWDQINHEDKYIYKYLCDLIA